MNIFVRPVGLLIALLGAIKLFRVLPDGFRFPPEWDFLCFYLYSAAARAGLNFYTAEGLAAVNLPVTPSRAFVTEIVPVGFPYPPPTMILFYPISWFSYHNAYLFWMALQTICLGGAIVLLVKETASKITPALIAALVLFWPSTQSTFTYAQTNFAVLAAILLARRAGKESLRGIWIAMATFIKPLACALLLYPTLKREWRVLFGAGLTLALGFVIAVAVFGAKRLADFFHSGVAGERPSVIYTELINQSLLSTLLRLTDFDFKSGSPLFSPWFLMTASVLFVVTAWLLYRSSHEAREDAFCLNLLFGLMVYPGTLEHYGVYLLIPMVVLLMNTKRPIFVGAVVFSTAALCTYRHGALMFVALIGLWILFAVRLQLKTWTLQPEAY